MRRALNNALSYRFSNDRAYDGGSTASTASIVGKWRAISCQFSGGVVVMTARFCV
jgi:hypothetical protein